MFYLTKETFDSIPIAVEFISAIEAVSIKGGLEPLSVVNEKHGGFNIVFLPQFAKENFSESGRIRRKEPDMKEFICFGIDSGVQPIFLTIDSNHSFVERDVIRACPTFRL